MIQDFSEVRDWILLGEGSQVEFKLLIKDCHKIARTICALANNKGGRIVIGVTDNGEIVGLRNEENTLKVLQDASQACCFPPISLELTMYQEGFKRVLGVWVEESNKKPHRTKGKDGNDQVYVRVQDKSMPASKMVERQLLNDEVGKPKITRKLDSKEQGLIVFLERNEQITLSRYMSLMNLSKRRARRILVGLVQEGILRVHNASGEDLYTLS